MSAEEKKHTIYGEKEQGAEGAISLSDAPKKIRTYCVQHRCTFSVSHYE